MCMYQGLGQMLTKCLQHHQGCSKTPKCAYVIYGQPLMNDVNGNLLYFCLFDMIPSVQSVNPSVQGVTALTMMTREQL